MKEIALRWRLRPHRLGVWPQIIALLLILALVGAMAIEPARQLFEQRDRIAGMAGDLRQIEHQNKKLEARIERLNDPDYIELRAREEAGLIRPGETAYVTMPSSRKSRRAEKRRKERKKALATAAPPSEPGFIEGLLNFIAL